MKRESAYFDFFSPFCFVNRFLVCVLCVISIHLGTPLSLLLGEDYREQDISEFDLSDQNLSGSQFDRTTIFSSGGNGVNLSNTLGTGADFSALDLSFVNFQGVNLTGVNLTDTNLSSAQYNSFTIWPVGYDPDAQGAMG